MGNNDVLKTTINKSIEYLEKLIERTKKDEHLSIASKLIVITGLIGLRESLSKELWDLENE